MKQWIPAQPLDITALERFSVALQGEGFCSPVVLEILFKRFNGDAAKALSFLHPSFDQLSDPSNLHGIDAAVERIEHAIQAHESITVFGDYDTDGVCATILLVHALQALGATVKPFFPNRVDEGYGLTDNALARCLTYSPTPQLLITVDCAITADKQVEALKARGIDVIVTDHHIPAEALPNCLTIDPHIDQPAGATGLCGAGVAFTLVRALAKRHPQLDPLNYIDLAALATIGDVMDLTEDNRILVAKGLEEMRLHHGNQGLQALLQRQLFEGKQESEWERLNVEKLAFGIIPCVNAASRMAISVSDKTSVNPFHYVYQVLGMQKPEFVDALVRTNLSRRAAVIKTQDIALKISGPLEDFNAQALVIGSSDEGFHSGVLGIVAARLMEKVHVPVALLKITETGEAHGSIRAPEGYSVVEALNEVSDLLLRYGGHAQAGGVTTKPGAYEEFKRRFEAACRVTSELTSQEIDASLDDEAISLDLCHELLRLEPFGHGNESPIFSKQFYLLSATPCGKDVPQRHLQIKLRDPDTGDEHKAIWFSSSERRNELVPGERSVFLFTLEIDSWRGERPVLHIIDRLAN